MKKTYVVGGIFVVIVIAFSLGVAFYTGAGPAPGGTDSGETITDFPTATDSVDESGETNSESTATSGLPPFTFTIDTIEDCGQTCRDVTATLDNNQDETATGITVYIRIFAGQNNTETDDMVWEGTEEVGTLKASGTHTTTERVELSLQEARKIDNNDGWITILTTVESDETTVTFQDSEQVA